MFQLNKEIADKIMSSEGEVKGVVFKTDERFIISKGGEEKVKEVEDEIKSLGYSIDYSSANTMSFYPIGLRVLSLLAIAKVFEMNEKEIKEMGSTAPKTSLVVKFFMSYFFSIEKVLEKVSDMWQRHWTVGSLSHEYFNEEKKEIMVVVKDMSIHPILCVYLTGYFQKISEMAINNKAIAKEIECPFKDGKLHKFLIKW